MTEYSLKMIILILWGFYLSLKLKKSLLPLLIGHFMRKTIDLCILQNQIDLEIFSKDKEIRVKNN